MSKYPLDIEAVHTDDERIYMSKGHPATDHQPALPQGGRHE